MGETWKVENSDPPLCRACMHTPYYGDKLCDVLKPLCISTLYEVVSVVSSGDSQCKREGGLTSLWWAGAAMGGENGADLLQLLRRPVSWSFEWV